MTAESLEGCTLVRLKRLALVTRYSRYAVAWRTEMRRSIPRQRMYLLVSLSSVPNALTTLDRPSDS